MLVLAVATLLLRDGLLKHGDCFRFRRSDFLGVFPLESDSHTPLFSAICPHPRRDARKSVTTLSSHCITPGCSASHAMACITLWHDMCVAQPCFNLQTFLVQWHRTTFSVWNSRLYCTVFRFCVIHGIPCVGLGAFADWTLYFPAWQSPPLCCAIVCPCSVCIASCFHHRILVSVAVVASSFVRCCRMSCTGSYLSGVLVTF